MVTRAICEDEMSDIVKRLRGFDTHKLDAWAICDEAADLIERQSEALRVARKALEPLAMIYDGYMWCNVSQATRDARAALAAIDTVMDDRS